MDFTVLRFSVSLYLMMGLGALLAYFDKWLTIDQMLAQNIYQGLPWWNHGGMRGDLVLMNPLAIYAYSKYRGEWNWRVFAAIALICFLASMFGEGKAAQIQQWIPQSHWHDGRRTPTGWVHIIYAAPVFATIAMLFFCSPSAGWKTLAVASAIITFHIWLGMQGDLKSIIKPFWYPIRWSLGDTRILASIAALTGSTALWKALA